MKPIEYFITEKGKNLKKSDKLLEEELEIIKILSNGRKNIYQILNELKKININMSWYLIERKLKLLEKEELVDKLC